MTPVESLRQALGDVYAVAYQRGKLDGARDERIASQAVAKDGRGKQRGSKSVARRAGKHKTTKRSTRGVGQSGAQ
jgi:hypothetical protein